MAPPPLIGTIEYVGRTVVATASVAGALFHKKGKAVDELHRQTAATSRETGIWLRCMMPRWFGGNGGGETCFT